MNPRLLRWEDGIELSHSLLRDLQADQILSEAAIGVLLRPCGAQEILRRQELFRLLATEEVAAQIEACRAALQELSRMRMLWQASEVAVERYHLLVRVLHAYAHVGEVLMGMEACGALWTQVAAWAATDEQRALWREARSDAALAEAQLRDMHSGMISFSDKIWLTPDGEGIGERARLAACAEALGFAVPAPRDLHGRLDRSLSDAMSALYAEQAAVLGELDEKYRAISLSATSALIDDIRFFEEIRALCARAGESGVPHCFPQVAQTPMLTATDLYDVTLLAKHCEHIVPNGAAFTEDEPFFFLIGANGGGKTTYLRAVGLNLVLFLAGCPVFAREARMYPFAAVAAHVPRDERFDGVGRLDEERARVAEMIECARGGTAFLLFNETFSGADEQRGFALLRECVDALHAAGGFGLYVTHFHEVMATAYPVLSALVDDEQDHRRTYRVVKSKGSAASHAADILRKYGLDRESLAARRCGHEN